LYSTKYSVDQIKESEMDITHIEEMINAKEIIVGKHGRKRPFERPGHGPEDIKIDLKSNRA
jgi:hypothetical protein